MSCCLEIYSRTCVVFLLFTLYHVCVWMWRRRDKSHHNSQCWCERDRIFFFCAKMQRWKYLPITSVHHRCCSRQIQTTTELPFLFYFFVVDVVVVIFQSLIIYKICRRNKKKRMLTWNDDDDARNDYTTHIQSAVGSQRIHRQHELHISARDAKREMRDGEQTVIVFNYFLLILFHIVNKISFSLDALGEREKKECNSYLCVCVWIQVFDITTAKKIVFESI